ncbi:MAG: hypothetical protein AAB388_00080 [Patescibacteria group bacterium]
MEPEQTVEPKYRLESLTKVTPFSKYLALALFIAMPFLGGWIGYLKGSNMSTKSSSSLDLIPLATSTKLSTGHGVTNPILKYFPNFSDIRAVKPDPTDQNVLWLAGSAGVMRVDIDSHKIADVTPEIPLLQDKFPTDLVRIGDKLFVSFQGGLLQHDLKNRSGKVFTTADGLASDSNISLVPDQYDQDVLWIGTFEGLSKLIISTGKIEKWQQEMGIYGTKFEPEIIGVDENHVWVSVGANAYSFGGIARLDKATAQWKAWNRESFNKGEYPERVDAWAAAAQNNRALVDEDDILYSYTSTSDEWTPITQYDRSDQKRRYMYLDGNSAYFLFKVPTELNISTNEKSNLLSPDMFTGAITLEDFVRKNNLVMDYDKIYDRLIMYPQYSNNVESAAIAILSLSSRNLDLIPFREFEKSLDQFNMQPLTANDGRIIFNRGSGLFDYDIENATTTKLSSMGVDVARIIGDKLVTLNLPQCEMSCQNQTATATIFSLSRSKQEMSVPLSDSEVLSYYIGSTTDDIYLLPVDYQAVGKAYWLDRTNQRFILKEFSEIPTNETRYGNLNYTNQLSLKSEDGKYLVTTQRNQDGNELDVLIQTQTNEQILGIVVGTSAYNHWDWAPKIHVTGMVFLSTQPHTLLIGTDRGLVQLSVDDASYKMLTAKEGLANSSIVSLFPTNKYLLVHHPNGVYVYNYEILNKKHVDK